MQEIDCKSPKAISILFQEKTKQKTREIWITKGKVCWYSELSHEDLLPYRNSWHEIRVFWGKNIIKYKKYF